MTPLKILNTRRVIPNKQYSDADYVGGTDIVLDDKKRLHVHVRPWLENQSLEIGKNLIKYGWPIPTFHTTPTDAEISGLELVTAIFASVKADPRPELQYVCIFILHRMYKGRLIQQAYDVVLNGKYYPNGEAGYNYTLLGTADGDEYALANAYVDAIEAMPVACLHANNYANNSRWYRYFETKGIKKAIKKLPVTVHPPIPVFTCVKDGHIQLYVYVERFVEEHWWNEIKGRTKRPTTTSNGALLQNKPTTTYNSALLQNTVKDYIDFLIDQEPALDSIQEGDTYYLVMVKPLNDSASHIHECHYKEQPFQMFLENFICEWRDYSRGFDDDGNLIKQDKR